MEDAQGNDKLIGELIKKRKAENEAFIKLLDAIESRSSKQSVKEDVKDAKQIKENGTSGSVL